MAVKAVSPMVQYLLDSIDALDLEELKEFREAMCEYLDRNGALPESVKHLKRDDQDGDELAGAGVPRMPKAPIMSGAARIEL